MSFADIIVISILIAVLSFVFYLTRGTKKGGCSGCHNDCSSCNAFSSFYEDYKNDQKQKEEE